VLRDVLELEHGPPSHDTFSRVFRLLDPEPFEAAFARFTAAFAGALEGVVAIDGKALRGAYERGRRATPLHLVNVWAAEKRLVIGQRLAPGRNEVAASTKCSSCCGWTAASSPPTRCTVGATPRRPSSTPGPIMLWHSRATSPSCWLGQRR